MRLYAGSPTDDEVAVSLRILGLIWTEEACVGMLLSVLIVLPDALIATPASAWATVGIFSSDVALSDMIGPEASFVTDVSRMIALNPSSFKDGEPVNLRLSGVSDGIGLTSNEALLSKCCRPRCCIVLTLGEFERKEWLLTIKVSASFDEFYRVLDVRPTET